MSTDPLQKEESEETKPTGLPADVNDDSCRLQFIELVPLARDTEGSCSLECEDEAQKVQVKKEDLPVMEQGPNVMVCYTISYTVVVKA